MSKLAPTSIKYIVRAQIKAKGVIEKPDVIGAIFGQTEGLLGSDLDLRELQRTGRIGRIDVNIKSTDGNSEGEIIIPSSLDSAETALIAATLETIERVGPCTAEIKLLKVEDTRVDKRKYVVDKAQEILKTLMDSGGENTNDISEKIKESVRVHEIVDYHGLPCGPAVMDSDEIIIVEGRADVLTLLRYGVSNAIAIQGTSIPDQVIGLAKEKTVTLFVDGDRGGKLIAKELQQKTEIDFVAMAPENKEVEELGKKEIFKALRDRIPAKQFNATTGRTTRINNSEDRPRTYERSRIPPRGRPDSRGPDSRRSDSRDSRDRRMSSRDSTRPVRKTYLKPTQKELFKKTLEELVGSRAAYIFDANNELLGKVPVAEVINTIKTLENPYAVVMDGKADYELGSAARKKGIKFIVAMDKDTTNFGPITVLSKSEL